MFKFRATDFQRITDALLEVYGITFITGLNNMGKSALVRALHALISGRSGDDHIRIGSQSKKAIVGGEFGEDPDNDPVTLSWVKGSAGSEYTINGEPFTKLGRRGVPLEDLEKHGFREIEFSGGRDNLMFCLQDDVHFLVSLPPTQVFDYISKVLQERQILPVVKAMAADAKALREEAVLLEGQIHTRKSSIATWETERQTLSPLLTHSERVLTLRETTVALQRMEETRGEIREVMVTMASLNEQEQVHGSLLDRASPLVEKYELAIQEHQAMQSLWEARVELEKCEKEIRDLDGKLSQALPLVEGYERALQEHQAMQSLWTQLWKAESELEDCEKDLRKIDEQIAEIPDLEKAEEIIGKLQEKRAEISQMEDLRMKIVEATEQAASLEEKAREAEQAVSEAELKYQKARAEIGICPTCGAEMGDCSE